MKTTLPGIIFYYRIVLYHEDLFSSELPLAPVLQVSFPNLPHKRSQCSGGCFPVQSPLLTGRVLAWLRLSGLAGVCLTVSGGRTEVIVTPASAPRHQTFIKGIIRFDINLPSRITVRSPANIQAGGEVEQLQLQGSRHWREPVRSDRK